MTSDKEQIKLHERVACLETKIINIGFDVDKILTNHLPHIQDRVDKIEAGMNKLLGVMIFLEIVIPILLAIYLKD